MRDIYWIYNSKVAVGHACPLHSGYRVVKYDATAYTWECAWSKRGHSLWALAKTWVDGYKAVGETGPDWATDYLEQHPKPVEELTNEFGPVSP